jgi:uncharacterized protein (DUF697 family)
MSSVSELNPNEVNQLTNAHETRLDTVGKLIARACAWSAAAAIIPMPIVDIAGLAAVQATLISDISELYGQSFKKDAANNVVSVLLGSLIPGTFGSSLKLIPGIGTIIGYLTFSAFAAASTYSLGKIIVRHFEKGGSASTFDPTSVADELKKEFTNATKSKSA